MLIKNDKIAIDKRIIAKIYSDTPVVVTVDASGECEVKASDIKCPESVEIINGDLHIATLSEGAKLVMEITMQKGRGYVSSEKNKENMHNIIGVIPVDSIYSPIDKVNYDVTNTRVGQVTDYDKLSIEIFADGTIAPEEALSLSAKILNDHMNLFIDLVDGFKKKTTRKTKFLNSLLKNLIFQFVHSTVLREQVSIPLRIW